MKRFFKYLMAFFAGILSLATLVVGLFLFILSRGPVNLDFLKSHVMEVATRKADTFDFKTLQLVWPTFDNPIFLEGLELQYAHGAQKNREVYIEKLQLTFPLKNLLSLKFTPQKILLEGAKISIHSFEGEVGGNQYKANLDFSTVNDFLEDLLDLKILTIVKSTLIIKDADAPVTFDLSADIQQTNSGLKGVILAQNQGAPGEISANISYEKASDKISVTLSMEGFDSKIIEDAVPDVFLQNLKFENFSASLSYIYFLKTKHHKATLKGRFSKVDITHSAYWKVPLQFPTLDFEGELQGTKFTIKEIATSIQGIPLKASTKGVIDEQKDMVNLETHVSVRNIPFKDLGKIWPQGAAEGAREWITENITEGAAPKAHLVMKSHLDFAEKKDFFTLDKLSGTIEISQAHLNYVDTMPPVEDLVATAIFDAEHFDIKIKSGHTHGLTITSGSLFIGKLSDPTSRLSLDLMLGGDLGKVLSLIDHKPLNYAKDYGLNAATSKGKTTANLKMAFPLLSPFDTAKIQTNVQAKVEDAYLTDLAGLDVILSKGALDIDVGKEAVTVKGSGLLNGEESDIQLVHKSQNNALDLTVKTLLTVPSLTRIWHESGLFFKGSAPLELHYVIDAKNEGVLDIGVDLKRAELNTLVFKKALGDSGKITLKGRYKKGRLQALEEIRLEGYGPWKMTGRAELLGAEGALSSLVLSWIHDANPVLKATYLAPLNKPVSFVLTGEKLDLKTFMDTDLSKISDPKHRAKHHVNNQPIDLKVEIQKVVFGRDLGLLNNILTAQIKDGFIQRLSYQGITEEAVEGSKDVFAEIYKKKNGRRKLRIQTAQGGAFLRALDVFENIRGGQLKLIAHHDPSFSKTEWIGKMKVREFVLLNAPLLTRIFSLFPTAGAELTTDSGMKFNLLKMRFGVSPKAFKIHAARANGISVGFNLSGLIERGKEGRLDLRGTMIPIYVLNTLVSKIPLIGEVISGGKNEGLFSVSFSVQGNKDNPDITANPLSIITPGFTRHIFPSQETSLGRDDQWIDENDESDSDIFEQEFNEKIE